MFDTSVIYESCWESKADIVVQQGGTWSGKTYGIMQCLFSLAISGKYTISIVGQDIPNLKRGALRDASSIIDSSSTLQSLIQGYNASDRIFKFYSGSIIEFVSFANEQDARNGKRDFLFINEANGISWHVAEHLINRTRIRSFIDYNPSAPFWAHHKLIYPRRFGNKSVQFVRSWHIHNTFLTADQHDHIEQRAKEDPQWGRVYARGNTGLVEELVFRNWDTVDQIPQEAAFIGNGLDFGYTNDPTAIVGVWRMNNELYIDLLLYDQGLTNDKIAEKLKVLSIKSIIVDSAEPKSRDELRAFGVYAEPAEKGKDSVNASIDLLLRQKLHITRRSGAMIEEFNGYKWKRDKATGDLTREIADRQKDHAIDALRYVALNKLHTPKTGEYFIY